METTIIWGYIGIILGLYRDYIGVILGLHWGYIGIMEKRMETTVVYIQGYGVYIGVILGIHFAQSFGSGRRDRDRGFRVVGDSSCVRKCNRLPMHHNFSDGISDFRDRFRGQSLGNAK